MSHVLIFTIIPSGVVGLGLCWLAIYCIPSTRMSSCGRRAKCKQALKNLCSLSICIYLWFRYSDFQRCRWGLLVIFLIVYDMWHFLIRMAWGKVWLYNILFNLRTSPTTSTLKWKRMVINIPTSCHGTWVHWRIEINIFNKVKYNSNNWWPILNPYTLHFTMQAR